MQIGNKVYKLDIYTTDITIFEGKVIELPNGNLGIVFKPKKTKLDISKESYSITEHLNGWTNEISTIVDKLKMEENERHVKRMEEIEKLVDIRTRVE